VNDVAKGITLAVEKEFPSGVFNLGSGVATSVADICGMAEKLVAGGQSLTEELRFKTKDTNQTSNFWADCTRSNTYLGWKPTTSLVDGIHRYWNSIS
jgi:nucleoside-diphosphate-sugar epimerase